MRVKMFYIWGGVGEAEDTINAWLEDTQPDVKYILQSYACDDTVIITIWYKIGQTAS